MASSSKGSTQLLQRGDVDVVLENDATLRYSKSENAGLTFRRTQTNAAPQRYGFVLPADDALREPLNRALLTRLDARPYERLLERYLPKE